MPQLRHLVDNIFGNNAYITNITDIGVRHNKYSTVIGLIKSFDRKLSIRGKVYSMFSLEKLEDISIPKKKNLGEDGVLNKMFGIFFDN